VASKVEQVHAGLFQKAINALESKRELAKVEYYVCDVCGNTVEAHRQKPAQSAVLQKQISSNLPNS